jgi:hypothetical protein
MSGRRYRETINRLLRAVESPRYLEVGSWMGSTLCAAIHGNPAVSALAIDNWSQFGGPRERFLLNLARHAPQAAAISFLTMDFRSVPFSALGPFNVYLFDGPHEREDQRDGLALALPGLDREFIFIVDDWNWPHVRAGTMDAVMGLGIDVLDSVEIRTTLDNSHPADSGLAVDEASDWHNGYFLAVLGQPAP